MEALYRKIAKFLKPNENGETSNSFRRQGSIRKVLPSVPDMDTQLSMSAKMISPRKNAHSYAPFVLEYSLIAEYNLLDKQKLPGIYVIPAAKTALQWLGVLFINVGIYQGGIFHFTLHIPETYPDCDAPRLVFSPPIFHPLVDVETGELDVNRGFSVWRRNVNHIWQILLFARRIFYKIDWSNPINSEAVHLFVNDTEMFNSKVMECVQQSKNCVYNYSPSIDDPNAIIFTHSDDSQYEETKKKMINLNKDDEMMSAMSRKSSGLSWVNPKSLEIFATDRNNSS